MDYLITLHRFLSEKLAYLSSFLTPTISWYGVVLLYAVFYIMIYFVVMHFLKKELTKRKYILHKLAEYNEANPSDYAESQKLGDEVYVKMLLQRKQPTIPDENYDEMWKIVEKQKPRPLTILVAFTFQVFVLAVFFSFFATIDVLSFHLFHYFVAFALSAVLILKKSKWLLRVAMLAVIGFFYWKLTAAALLFLSLVSLFRLAEKILKK